MVLLVIVGDALEDLDAVLDGGFVHRHRLEAPLQGGVLLDVLAVLGKGGGADDLDLAPAQGGLQDIGGVHAALGVPGADDVMHLVDDQDDVALLADLLDESLHAALELAAELGPGHQSRQIQQEDLLVLELVGDAAHGDALGQALGNGGLAHAGLADEAGVVLLAAVQDLDHPLQLLFPAHHGIQLAFLRPGGQIDAVVIQEFALGRAGRLALGALGRTLIPLGGAAGAVLGGGAAEQPVQEGEGGGLAVVIPLAALVFQVQQLFRPVQGVGHIAGQVLQLLVRDPQLVDHVVHGLDVQLAGALEAQALVFGLIALDFGNEDHRHVLAAAGAECWLHGFASLGNRICLANALGKEWPASAGHLFSVRLQQTAGQEFDLQEEAGQGGALQGVLPDHESQEAQHPA